jgi:tartrate dehydrogenase/decarboxylase/D-malate dehydrogenase
MLDFFGYEDWGKKVLDAIEKLMVENVKEELTPDMGGTGSTSSVGDGVIKYL